MAAEHKPIDGGWGWFCCLAGCLCNMLTVGQLKAYGVLLLELKAQFGTSSALTMWPSGIAYALAFGLGIVTSALVNKFGHRRVTMVGGFVAGTGMSLCYFANSLPVMFILYGFVYGIGCGLSAIPGISILPFYFEKNLSLATGLAISGTAIGTIAFPLLMQMLIDELNYNGALLICGGITFHLVVAGALMRPVNVKTKSSSFPEQNGVTDRDAKKDSGSSTNNEYTKANSHLTNSEKLSSSGQTSAVLDSSLKSSLTEFIESSEHQDDKLFHWHLLKNPLYDIFVFIVALFVFGYLQSYILLPSKSAELEDDSLGDAVAVSLMSFSELAFRIIFGILWDKGVFRKPNIRRLGFALLCAIGGVGFILIDNVSTVNGLIIWSVLMGIILSGALSPVVIIIVDLVGPLRTGEGLGVMFLFEAVIVVIGPLITGFLQDLSGSVSLPFAVMGGSLLLAAVMLVIMVVMDKTRFKTQHENETRKNLGDYENPVYLIDELNAIGDTLDKRLSHIHVDSKRNGEEHEHSRENNYSYENIENVRF